MKHRLTYALLGAVLAASAHRALAQPGDEIEIEATRLAVGVYMLTGKGGNIGLSAGPDGAFLIDDQYAPLTRKIRDAVALLTPAPIRFVINTHWHGDHTGGNERLGTAGVLIVAHENVRQRMSTEQFDKTLERMTPPAPEKALPVVTFEDSVTFHVNGDTIHVFHLPRAHTDGDSVIHFRKANVLHLGDVFFSGRFPAIDLDSGGSIDGLIEAVERILEIADDETRIIPGHGPPSRRADLVAYRDMLRDVRERIGAMVRAGKGLDEVLAAKPTATYDEPWGTGSVDPTRFVSIVYASLSR